jgi:hypothetical protein
MIVKGWRALAGVGLSEFPPGWGARFEIGRILAFFISVLLTCKLDNVSSRADPRNEHGPDRCKGDPASQPRNAVGLFIFVFRPEGLSVLTSRGDCFQILPNLKFEFLFKLGGLVTRNFDFPHILNDMK